MSTELPPDHRVQFLQMTFAVIVEFWIAEDCTRYSIPETGVGVPMATADS